MSVGSRIRELRESKNISRSDFANSIGVTVGAVSNYENEVSSPKEPILFKIMEVLGCDANYLFQDAVQMPTMRNSVSIEEFSIIKKYRALDEHGKEMVDFTLEKEWERSKALEKQLASYSQALPDAAQARTDISVPTGTDTSDDDIMDDDNF